MASDAIGLNEKERMGRRAEVREEAWEREGEDVGGVVEEVKEEDLMGRMLEEGERDRERREGGLSGRVRGCDGCVFDRMRGLREEGETELRILLFSSASSVCTRRLSASSCGGGTIDISLTCRTLAVPLIDPRKDWTVMRGTTMAQPGRRWWRGS